MAGLTGFAPIGAVFTYELAANSGNSWTSQAPNLHSIDTVVKCLQNCLNDLRMADCDNLIEEERGRKEKTMEETLARVKGGREKRREEK